MKIITAFSFSMAIVLLTGSCNIGNHQDNLKKLPEITCVIYCQVLFELDLGGTGNKSTCASPS